MKKATFIAIALIAAGSAFANEAADDQANRATFSGSQTRAEIKAATLAAKDAGQLGQTEYQANQQPAPDGVRSRFDTRMEAVQAAKAHTIHELY